MLVLYTNKHSEGGKIHKITKKKAGGFNKSYVHALKRKSLLFTPYFFKGNISPQILLINK